MACLNLVRKLLCVFWYLSALSTCTAADPCRVYYPNPSISIVEVELVRGSETRLKYRVSIDNHEEISDELFAPSPDLPPCGANTEAPRTWINIYDHNKKRLNGFCSITSPDRQFWFAGEPGEIRSAYIMLWDRRCNKQYTSNVVQVPSTLSPTPQPTSPPTRPPPTLPPTKKPSPAPTFNPTLSPTPLPSLPPTTPPSMNPTTMEPTPFPTVEPTKTPTFSPTRDPTQNPTPKPTLDPTKALSPVPTSPPTRDPTQSPTPKPTLDPTKAPSPLPTSPPTRDPTQSPTPKPTLDPTKAPSPSPTSPPTTATPTFPPSNEANRDKDAVEPTPAPRTKPPIDRSGYSPPEDDSVRGTGQVCSNDSQCFSETCRNGACMASKDCFPVKHKYGTPFDKHSINIVFVPSSFDKSKLKAWRGHVDKTYNFFRKFNMFSDDIQQLNFFRVDELDEDKSRLCELGCKGIDRLLCCSVQEAHRLTEKCLPVGSNTQTVVVHKSRRYGGAGFPASNVATMTTNPRGVEVALHELGHSLFELGDEYSYFGGAGTEVTFPNCDTANTCDKWSDLMGKNDALPYEPVKCVPGCQNNASFVGESSYMKVLTHPVGAVNERFTCCTYLALTKSMPSYCDVFDFTPNYLFEYCKNNDFQHYGASNYDREPKQYIPGKEGISEKDAKYVYLNEPLLVKIRIKKNGKAVVEGKPVRVGAGMYPKSQVQGDFIRVKDAEKQGVDSLVKVRVVYTGGKEVLLFSRNTTIDVPIPPDETGASHDVAPQSISEKRDTIELVLNSMGRRVKRVSVKTVKPKTTNS